MREKLSYPVRIIISLLSIFLWSFPAEGQDSESLKKQLDQKLNSFARQYVSSRTIKIDSILIQKKKVTLFANEALEDIPFREYNVSELYASIAPLFPNASKIVILTRGTDIESLIPEYDRKGRPNKKRLYSIKESKYPLTRSLSSPHEIKNGLQNRHISPLAKPWFILRPDRPSLGMATGSHVRHRGGLIYAEFCSSLSDPDA